MNADSTSSRKERNSGIDFPWPVAVIIALLFALGLFVREPHTVTAEQRWHQQHGR
jgi:hypothetical protein